jgi:hypothetical protein
MFAEVFRGQRPGGVFLTIEITNSWIHRVSHFRSTFTPVTSGPVLARLTAAGFSRISVDWRRGAFRFRAARAEFAGHPIDYPFGLKCNAVPRPHF